MAKGYGTPSNVTTAALAAAHSSRTRQPTPKMTAPPTTTTNDLQFAQHPDVRRYSETSLLSQLDVKLTTLLSNLPISVFPGLPVLPFLYGHTFGAPVVALVTFPPFMFSTHPLVQLYSLVTTVSWLLVFLYTKSRKSLTNVRFILPGLVGTTVLAVYSGGNALDTYCLYLCSWLYATVVCFLGKTFFLRARPAEQRRQENNGKGGGDVSASPFWCFFSQEHTTWPNNLHSFPSFDSAGAACAVTTMYLQHYYNQPQYTPVPLWLWTIVPLAWYGRIYFLAHHVVDVLCGTLVGVVCTGYVYFGRLSTANVYPASPLIHTANHHYDILWLIICLISIGAFFAIPGKFATAFDWRFGSVCCLTFLFFFSCFLSSQRSTVFDACHVVQLYFFTHYFVEFDCRYHVGGWFVLVGF